MCNSSELFEYGSCNSTSPTGGFPGEMEYQHFAFGILKYPLERLVVLDVEYLRPARKDEQSGQETSLSSDPSGMYHCGSVPGSGRRNPSKLREEPGDGQGEDQDSHGKERKDGELGGGDPRLDWEIR